METQEVQTAVGETFLVQFQAIGSAGYQWELRKLPEEFRLEAGTTEVSKGTAPGSATTQKFQLRALKPGAYEIVFVYKRAWESETEATRIVSVKVQ